MGHVGGEESIETGCSDDKLCSFPHFIQSSPARSVPVSVAPPAESMFKSSFPGKILILLFLLNFI